MKTRVAFSLLIVLAGRLALAAEIPVDPARLAALEALGKKDDEPSRQELLKVLQDTTAHAAEREASIKALTLTKAGGLALVTLAGQEKVPEEFIATATFACASSAHEEVRKAAEAKLPVPRTKDGLPLPTIDKLAAMSGDAVEGAKVFRDAKGANCIGCHQIGNEGKMVGPPLSSVGEKLSKRQIYESILTPSAGILMGYENWLVKTKTGEVKMGILAENTPDHITLKDTQANYIDIPIDDVEKKVKQAKSIMPEELIKTMTQPDLINLVEYLSKQKYEQK